jgi:uncharacterized protein (TIGR00297 family)
VSNFSFFNMLVGFGLAVIISWAAWRVRSLNWQGALAAALLGTIVFGLGGLAWAILLMTFFISSSALSRLFRRQKKALDATFSKGGQRDAWQVAANGGVAGLFVLLHAAFPSADWVWAAYAGAMAAANADTWATELGVLSPSVPRMITSWKPVPRGTSGGITLAGTLASLSGSALVAVPAVFLWQGPLAFSADGSQPSTLLLPFAAITLAGLGGSLVDSLLGATVQGIYHCPTCQKETERHPLHNCGTPTRPVRGWPWMNNDWVNILCTLAGALLAAAVFLL